MIGWHEGLEYKEVYHLNSVSFCYNFGLCFWQGLFLRDYNPMDYSPRTNNPITILSSNKIVMCLFREGLCVG